MAAKIKREADAAELARLEAELAKVGRCKIVISKRSNTYNHGIYHLPPQLEEGKEARTRKPKVDKEAAAEVPPPTDVSQAQEAKAAAAVAAAIERMKVVRGASVHTDVHDTWVLLLTLRHT
jgi:hypothetical protein